MATVKVKFRPSTVADRPGSIIIIVTNHRVVRQITTGYKVFPCEWDEKQSQLVSTVENGRMDAIKSITHKGCVGTWRDCMESSRDSTAGNAAILPMMSSRSSNVPARRIPSLFLWRMSLSG